MTISAAASTTAGTGLADDLGTLRGMLEEQRAFRVEQLIQLHSPVTHTSLRRPLSSADLEIFASLTAGARAALSDVQEALWRMDEGTYGLCTGCGDALDLRRLEILPQAALCPPCQRSADESAHDRRG